MDRPTIEDILHLNADDLEFAHTRLGEICGEMLAESKSISRATAVLEVCARCRWVPPAWAVRLRWPKRDIVHRIRAVAVLECSGTKYKRDGDVKQEKMYKVHSKFNRFVRAAELLKRIKRTNPELFCGLPVPANQKTIKTSYEKVADRRYPAGNPYRYNGLKSSLSAELPLLVAALEQRDTPPKPLFFW